MDVVSEAIALLAKHKGYAYGLYSDALGKELAANVLTRTAVVNEVFTQIITQGYSNQELIDVSRAFLDTLAPAQVSQILKDTTSSILLVRVKGFLSCFSERFKSAARCMKIDAAFGSVTGQVSARAVRQSNQTPEPRQLSKAEIDLYIERGQNQPLYRNNNGKLSPVPESKRRLFNREVVWELPEKGIGYVVYNRNDISGSNPVARAIGDEKGLDQIGTKETIARIINIAKQWNALYSDRPLEIGDISRPGGINTTEHSTHVGNEFDVRAQSKSKTVAPLNIIKNPSDYDRPLTKEFILMVRKLYPGVTFLFNDSELNARDRDVSGFIAPAAGHNDHIHVIFP